MQSFREFIREQEAENDLAVLNEGAFKTASTATLVGHITAMRNKIKRTKKVSHETLDALASMNLATAYLVVSLDLFATRGRDHLLGWSLFAQAVRSIRNSNLPHRKQERVDQRFYGNASINT